MGILRASTLWSSTAALATLGAAVVLSCGGTSSRTNAPAEMTAGTAGATATAGGTGNAGAEGGGTGGEHVGGAASAGKSGSGGVTVIGSEPAACQTQQGLDGILVDTFPYPSPQPQCEALNQSGVLDTSCPSEPQIKCAPGECLMDEPLAGCCRDDGSCGLWDTGVFSDQKRLGCISRAPWIENSSWLGGTHVPVSCKAK